MHARYRLFLIQISRQPHNRKSLVYKLSTSCLARPTSRTPVCRAPRCRLFRGSDARVHVVIRKPTLITRRTLYNCSPSVLRERFQALFYSALAVLFHPSITVLIRYQNTTTYLGLPDTHQALQTALPSCPTLQATALPVVPVGRAGTGLSPSVAGYSKPLATQLAQALVNSVHALQMTTRSVTSDFTFALLEFRSPLLIQS